MDVVKLNTEEIDLLWSLKRGSPQFFKALIFAASIIEERGEKYTGQLWDGNSEFDNFIADSRIQDVPVRGIFIQWLSKKFARIMMSRGDYRDESYLDSIRDLANYALLFLRWEMRAKKGENHEHGR